MTSHKCFVGLICYGNIFHWMANMHSRMWSCRFHSETGLPKSVPHAVIKAITLNTHLVYLHNQVSGGVSCHFWELCCQFSERGTTGRVDHPTWTEKKCKNSPWCLLEGLYSRISDVWWKWHVCLLFISHHHQIDKGRDTSTRRQEPTERLGHLLNWRGNQRNLCPCPS